MTCDRRSAHLPLAIDELPHLLQHSPGLRRRMRGEALTLAGYDECGPLRTADVQEAAGRLRDLM